MIYRPLPDETSELEDLREQYTILLTAYRSQNYLISQLNSASLMAEPLQNIRKVLYRYYENQPKDSHHGPQINPLYRPRRYRLN